MKKLLVSLAALTVWSTVGLAGQPILLSDAQMDKATAGQDGTDIAIVNTGAIAIGNFGSRTATIAATLTSKTPSDSGVANTAVAQAAAQAVAASAITASFVVSGSNAAAIWTF